MEMGIGLLPFKMTVPTMLEATYQAVKASSYQDAEDALRHNYGLRIGDDTVRKVTSFIGEIVFKEDSWIADECMAKYQKAEIPFTGKKTGTLYIRRTERQSTQGRGTKLGQVGAKTNSD